MPSFKTCLTSLAMMAMAFSPIADARKTHSGALAARAPLVERGNSDVAAIRSARGSSVASARASASRTTSKVASVRGAKAKPAVGTLRKATKVKAYNPYHKNSKFMTSKAVKYVTSFRCRSDAMCNQILSSVFPTENGVPTARGVCLPGSRTCSVTCNEGYVPSGVNCVAETPTCASETCAQFANGYNTCNSAGNCRYSCYDGFKLATSTSGGTTSIRCLALDTDPDNCVSAGNVCPASYNGVGRPLCNKGCTLRCPRGLSVKRTASADKPFTCYGPGVPLTETN